MARKSRWSGRSKLRRKLSIMLPKEVKVSVQRTIGQAAQIIYKEAAANVPRDTGELGESLKVRHRGDKLGATVGYFKKGNIRAWRKAGWRAHFTEFGTRGGGNVPGQPAQPFLGPSYMRKKDQVIRMIDRSVNKALRKVSRGNFG